MTMRTMRIALLGLMAVCALAATPAAASAQAADDISGVWRYDGANRGPEEITITKIGESAYRLEVMNTGTRVSRWQMLGFFRDGQLSTIAIDRPGNGARLVSFWTGRLVRPGVIEVQGRPMPGPI